jgi:hypothetical protein
MTISGVDLPVVLLMGFQRSRIKIHYYHEFMQQLIAILAAPAKASLEFPKSYHISDKRPLPRMMGLS